MTDQMPVRIWAWADHNMTGGGLFPYGVWSRTDEAGKEPTEYVRADAIKALRGALTWYGENARLARLIHTDGDEGRNALVRDGGRFARTALAEAES